MNAFAPKDFTFTVNDTYAMQSICAYESNYIGLGMSAFCDLFTLEEWQAFEITLDTEYYCQSPSILCGFPANCLNS